jgi:hypothetical protein
MRPLDPKLQADARWPSYIHNDPPSYMIRGGIRYWMGEEIKTEFGTDPRPQNQSQAAQASGTCAAAFWLR